MRWTNSRLQQGRERDDLQSLFSRSSPNPVSPSGPDIIDQIPSVHGRRVSARILCRPPFSMRGGFSLWRLPGQGNSLRYWSIRRSSPTLAFIRLEARVRSEHEAQKLNLSDGPPHFHSRRGRTHAHTSTSPKQRSRCRAPLT